MAELVLASQSPRRKELLRLISEDFIICPDDSPENADESLLPNDYVTALSMEKCMNVAEKFDEVYCVELIASEKTRLERNCTENRLKHKASKRDVAVSNERLLAEGRYRLVSNEGEIPFENYLRIYNDNLPADVVARMIKEHFHL